MKGAVLSASDADGKHGLKLTVREDLPNPGEDLPQGWALVKVLYAGICGTDLEMLQNYKPGFQGVIGHEFVGQVEVIKGHANCMIKTGARVVGEINIPCGECGVCTGQSRQAHRNHCPNRRCLGIWNHNGCFAEHLTLPISNLFLVPENVPNNIAVFTEPVAAACRVIEQLDTELTSIHDRFGNPTAPLRVAILGDGRLGLIIASVLRLSLLRQVEIVVIGKHASKLALLEPLLDGNVSTATTMKTHAMNEGPEIARETFENYFDLCVEATGTHTGFHMSTWITRPLGTVVLKSTCACVVSSNRETLSNEMTLQMEARNRIVVNELNILGSRCGPFPPALQLLSAPHSGPLLQSVLLNMVHSVFPLDKIDEAISTARGRGVLKVLLQP